MSNKSNNFTKAQNTKNKLWRIILNNSPLSRFELSAQLQVSLPTLDNFLKELRKKKLIRELNHGNSTGGRRPYLIEVNPEAGLIIGVHINMEEIRVVLTDLKINILKKLTKNINVQDGKDKIINQIVESMAEIIDQADFEKIKGIGLGIPGMINTMNGISISFPWVSDWTNVPLKKIIEEKFRINVFINNEMFMKSLAERYCGSGRGIANFLLIDLSSGISLTSVVDGKVYRGFDENDGELGHLVMKEDGPLCYCGNNGCLESLASAKAIIEAAKEAISKGVRTEISTLAGNKIENITIPLIFQAASSGDRLADNILENASRYLGLAIANAITLFNPQAVIFSGTLISAGDILLKRVENVIKSKTIPGCLRNLKIFTSSLGEDIGYIGAGVCALENLKVL